MSMISKTALAAALLAAAGGIVAAPPALARDQDKAAPAQQAPQLKLSDEFRKAAVPVQQALDANDLATATSGIAAAEAAAKTDDERYVVGQLRLSLTAKQQQAAGGADAAANARSDAALAAPLDALINNPSTPRDLLGKYAYLRGTIAFNQGKYADALAYYAKAQAAGYQDPNMPLQMAKSKVESGDIPGGIALIDSVVKQEEASGQKPSENLYRYAIGHLLKTQDRATTLDWMKRWLTAYPSPKNWRDAIQVFGFEGPAAERMAKPDRLDLYRLMSVTGALADQGDYLRYAQLAFDLGLPEETETVITKGRAAGKIPSGNAAAATLLKQAQNAVAHEGSLASLAAKANASAKGDLAAQTANAYLGKGDYAHAIELYKAALQKGAANPDQVNMHLGIAEALSGDKAGATTQFAAVQNQPAKDVASLWQAWAAAGAGATATASPAVATPQG